MNYSHPLDEKIRSPQRCDIKRSFSVWTDLLGFGRNFSESDWSPPIEIWKAQAKRAADAYRIQCQNVHVSMNGEGHMLLLNDGMIRTLIWTPEQQIIQLGLWLRAAVFSHSQIFESERSRDLPGPRSIISAGWIAEHSFDEVKVDDLVFNYTRSKPGLSKIATTTGNPVLVSNPSQLQLNTGFSRAFLLDEAGSRAGLSGPSMYIDKAFLDAVVEICDKQEGVQVNDWIRKDDRVFCVEFTGNSKSVLKENDLLTLADWDNLQPEIERRISKGEEAFPSRNQPLAFGFLLEKDEISVDLPNLKTKAYRVMGYYPNDEDPSGFMIELANRSFTNGPKS
ncbi:hypothetical protein ACSW0I_001002 [Vibrio fluvialis]|uniref:hypothetical protein n=1 Tax=Vibrio fluvialis TaxID=676 RepID=UPI00192CA524|nr:hypothetical protein [Vibrio fluvialis]MBL4259280.1 hypothetical protein [Vibrio fluvialis]MBY7999063.1 hypothetical protein [Vibrio fluvialis]